ncbi:hypothetical protein DERF_003289 [Dermatophagoides farinae]|uniref:Uncharacterized protein n=1 Tax=Dermatophagoides farinae TaxID=6954 RepID=A0A922ICA8_DERFA|nr:hypothetical protein DERF_003289 [Dermatophagoides farinae]
MKSLTIAIQPFFNLFLASGPPNSTTNRINNLCRMHSTMDSIPVCTRTLNIKNLDRRQLRTQNTSVVIPTHTHQCNVDPNNSAG